MRKDVPLDDVPEVNYSDFTQRQDASFPAYSYFDAIDEASAPEANFSTELGDIPYISNQGSTS
ncbi:MAG: hypothetical protein J6P37_06815, partial [Lachnospiraceae bacterium]|nr:hypothetical protein [Lachnospiraceae bacterium]